MKNTLPNYTDLGFADCMGPQLKAFIEHQLREDLQNYQVSNIELMFDWSESCVEGHRTEHLDGSVENFSGISVFDGDNNLVANGWMEFIKKGDFFLVYWEFLTTWNNGQKLKEKKQTGIPNHIWIQIPDILKPDYQTNIITNKLF